MPAVPFRFFPRRLTVLGFCLVVIALLVFAVAPTIAALAGAKGEHHLILWVLVFVAVVVVSIVVLVLGVAIFSKNPMRLNLRDVSGTEFTDYARFLALGDNISGSHPVIEGTAKPGLPPEEGSSDDRALPGGGEDT